jgi:hypothetical protein
MTSAFDPGALQPDRIFDGGDLDCGSGLVLLIREHMLQVPVGGVLEMRSREVTVRDELPPWCRMVGHEYLGQLAGEEYDRFFIRRGAEKVKEEEQALAGDKARAREYEWRARVRATGRLKSTVYCRNFSYHVGQPASFEERDEHPSAVEYVLGALAGDLCTGFTNECATQSLNVDDVEISVRGKLNNVLAHLGLDDGDPSFSSIELKCFASTLDNEAAVRGAWERTVARSPLASTLAKALDLNLKLSVV